MAGAFLILAITAAWWNSRSVPFHFDDLHSIVGNPTIRQLWPPDWLRPPATGGETVSGRPVLNLSFAVNYAVHALDVRGYHAGNLVVHLVSALLLFGIVRRAAGSGATTSGALGNTGTSGAAWFAFAVALLWSLHPLQTASVTYLVQRAESLAGMFYLLTLYGFIRAAEPGPTRARWAVISVLACLLGMGTKETLATVPLVVLLYDRTFISGSFRAAWRAHGRLYVALATTWLLLVVLIIANQGRGGSAGLGTSIGAWTYLLTQADAITRYLILAFWPASQVFDYGTPVAAGIGAVLPQILLLTSLAAGTIWGLRRNHVTGFIGAWFFLTLAPSSSFVPVATQTMAEHRMYLALAAVVAFIALAFSRRWRRAPRWVTGAAVAVAAVVLGALTVARNTVYRSELTLWQDTVAKRPDNPRARHNLGQALVTAGRPEEAVLEFRRAIELQPHHAFAHASLAQVLLTRGELADAEAHLRAALAADPRWVDAWVNLGLTLARLGRTTEAIAAYETALAIDPHAQDARTNLAGLMIDHGQIDEGIARLRDVLAAAPDLAEARYHLGMALDKSGERSAAEAELRTAVRLKPDLAPAHLALGNVLMRRGDGRAAAASYQESIRLDPGSAEARFALGNVHAQREDFDTAIQLYREALERDPRHVQATNNLANSQLATGRVREAIGTYEAVLRMRPDDQVVRRNLALAREYLQQASTEPVR
jgi:protein O-mannosyl-transferase